VCGCFPGDVMEHDALRWAIVDLLKVCDVAHEGRLHGDLARIARTLGVELSLPPQSKEGEEIEAKLLAPAWAASAAAMEAETLAMVKDLHFSKAKKALKAKD
jgi:hypothetical protein